MFYKYFTVEVMDEFSWKLEFLSALVQEAFN